MYTLAPRKGRNTLSIIKKYFLYLSMLRYYVMLVPIRSELPLQKRLKVVIAAGLTSSHSEQRS